MMTTVRLRIVEADGRAVVIYRAGTTWLGRAILFVWFAGLSAGLLNSTLPAMVGLLRGEQATLAQDTTIYLLWLLGSAVITAIGRMGMRREAHWVIDLICELIDAEEF
jgi:hypothetical protein